MTTNLAVRVQGTGPDLVMLHGWGLNASIWAPVEQELAAHYRLWMVDLPGFGDSPWHGIDDFAEACQWLSVQLTEVVGGPFHLLGWSLGGLIASEIVRTHPDNIESLILVASSPYFPADSTQNWPGIKPDILQDFSSKLEFDFEKTLDRFLSVQALGSPKAREEIKTMRTLLKKRPAPNIEALDSGLQWLANVDLRSLIENQQIIPPYMRIFGHRDSLVSASQAVQSCDHIFRQSAHAPFLTEPEKFTSTIVAFHHDLPGNH